MLESTMGSMGESKGKVFEAKASFQALDRWRAKVVGEARVCP
jgi:hypothetical protein